MDSLDYRIIIDRLPVGDGGGFAAVVPDLPGCMSDGETPAEAANNVQDAIRSWIEEALRMGRPIPEPTRGQTYA
jgi:antitoxin HicB